MAIKTLKLNVKTDLQKEREARELAIYNEYARLTENPAQSRTEVNKYMMKKYGIHSNGTLYEIRKRVARRLAGQ